MKRKDTIREWLNPPVPTTPVSEAHDPGGQTTRPERTGAGAVRLMGVELQKLSADAETGRALRSQLSSGANVVELEPELIEPSFVRDRISQSEDEAFQDLVTSIRTHGQQVPILVRPHPEKSGHYQIAYGNRRLRAAITLGFKVRAVVREMTNTEVVIAQGKENSERRDLSFIERALFARNLEEAGFDRNTVIAALSLDRTEVVRLLTVSRAIPGEVVYAIGPAPKAGRNRWMALAQFLKGRECQHIVDRLVADPGFRQADSDSRFAMLLAALSSLGEANQDGSTWLDPLGRPVVKIKRAKSKTRFTIDEKLAPRFGLFLTDKLNELYAAFSAGRGSDQTG